MNNIYKDIEENTILDTKILDSLEKEKSIISKELLICYQLHVLHGKMKNKEAINQAVLFLIRLLKYNNQTYESLNKELEDGKRLLKIRVEKGIKEKNIHKEIYNNLLKIAERHFNEGKKHLKLCKEKNCSNKHHLDMAHYHKTKAEEIYDGLLVKDIKKIMKHLAIIKLTEVYEMILQKCEKVANIGLHSIKNIHNGKSLQKELNKSIHEIHRLLLEQNLILIHFAVNYSKTLIHAAEYYDYLKNKIVLYVHK